jgi:uncharacterized membrane protein
MRKYRLHDTARGVTILIAGGVVGLLLWVATQVGQQSTARFWASMWIVAAAGLIFVLAQTVGGWTSGLRLRFSTGTFLIGFVPSLVVIGWIMLATQPGGGWHGERFASWSSSLGLLDVMHDLGLWHGVLAFGLGLVLGLSLDVVPAAGEVVVVDQGVGLDETAPPPDRWAADEPLAAERDAARAAEPHTVVVGRGHDTDET